LIKSLTLAFPVEPTGMYAEVLGLAKAGLSKRVASVGEWILFH
jgi:hypothetical protein